MKTDHCVYLFCNGKVFELGKSQPSLFQFQQNICMFIQVPIQIEQKSSKECILIFVLRKDSYKKDKYYFVWLLLSRKLVKENTLNNQTIEVKDSCY